MDTAFGLFRDTYDERIRWDTLQDYLGIDIPKVFRPGVDSSELFS